MGTFAPVAIPPKSAMKNTLKKLFLPITDYFDSGEGEYIYKASHRTILKVLGGLLLALSFFLITLVVVAAQLGGLLPFIVFFLLGSVCVIVGVFGSDRAVAKIWGSK